MTSPFQRVDDHLHWQGVNLVNLAREIGTPVLLYSADRIRENLAWLRSSLKETGQPHEIAYALKACGHIAIAALLQAVGTWAEVMSLGEYRIARQAGFSPDQLIVNGLGWHNELIDRAVAEGALLQIDNENDLERVAHAAQRHGTAARIGVRVIPDIDVEFAPYGSKLGIPIRGGAAAHLLTKISRRPELNCVSISTHTAHRLSRPEPLGETARAIVGFAQQQKERLNLPLQFINLGGGLDDHTILERGGWQPADYFQPVAAAMEQLGPEVKLIIEPGRFLIGDAGVALSEVVIKKISGGEPWLIADLGTNILIPIPAAHYEVYALFDPGGERSEISVADGICSPTSVIQTAASLPSSLRPGDLVAIAFVGSYTLALAENWAYQLPQVVLLDEDKITFLIDNKRAEDLFAQMWGLVT